ncbi:phage holin family protein [Bacillus pinisoli]|uniref:phage holin family protein n=1 Tax=Bacillus pinisoli TaxID=2901866 RepID=UPI001FF428BA|nr:phage holin family protein [Bacillus pinisoli]
MKEYSMIMFVSVAGSVSSYLFGGWNSLLTVLTFMIMLDYTTGVIAAAIEKKLSSRIGFKGIAQKLLIFALVSVAHMIDMVIGVNHLVRDATVIFYIMNEIISIIENAKRVGLPIPVFLIKVIQLFKSKSKKK